MRTFLLLGLFLVVGCTKPAVVKDVTVAEAAAHVKNGTATLVDANDDDYRSAVGIVPGAVKLTSFNEYALAELPADKGRPLVFYCTSKL